MSTPAKEIERTLQSDRVAQGRAALTSPTPAERQQVENYLQKFREWEESFRSPARRRAYIKRLCRRIAERFQPEKVILFGSHAYGQPTPESDVDLLVVMNFEGSPIQQAIKISRELGLVTPLDLLVRTPAQVRERLRIEDPFMREIIERGKVLYEAAHG
jgi:predicted nucleotidyltransferase